MLDRIMGLPPSEATTQLITAEESPGTAVTPDGARGGPLGIVALDEVEGTLLPTAFWAVTRKVYVVPLLSPVTVVLRVEPPTVAVMLPGVEVT